MQLTTLSLLPNRQNWRKPATWLGAGLLLAAFLALNVTSSGITGGDDTGSGIGGTGRSAEPGSGLGGTGMKPFLGFDPDSASGPGQQSDAITILPPDTDRSLALTAHLNLDIPARRDIEHTPLPSPAQVAAAESFTRDSSAINISEQIQRDIDRNALSFTRPDNGASAANQAPATTQDKRDASDPAAKEIAEITAHKTAPRGETTRASGRGDNGRTGDTATNNSPTAERDASESLTWGSLASYLAEQTPPASDAGSAADTDADQTQRLERPERVVRPELPPLQRVRPIQRAAVLPPRIKPLSL